MQTQKPGQSTEESTPLLSEPTTTLSITTLPKPKKTKEVSLSTTAKIYSDSGCKWNITTKSLLGGGIGAAVRPGKGNGKRETGNVSAESWLY